MDIDRRDTAVVFTDPQNEVLSETGRAWPLVRESLAENNTIENMDRLFAAAKESGFEVFISPQYFDPTAWRSPRICNLVARCNHSSSIPGQLQIATSCSA